MVVLYFETIFVNVAIISIIKFPSNGTININANKNIIKITIINDFIIQLENNFSLKINVSLDRKLQDINITYDDNININIYKNEESFNYELVNYVNTYIHDLYSDRGFLAIKFVEEFEKNYDEDSYGLDFIKKTVIDSFTTTFESTNEKGDKYSFEKHYTVTRYEFDDLSAIKYDILENKYYLIFSKATESDLFAMGNVYYSDHSMGNWAIPFTNIYFAKAGVNTSTFWCTESGWGTTSAGTIRCFRPNASTGSTGIRIFAFGRWK